MALGLSDLTPKKQLVEFINGNLGRLIDDLQTHLLRFGGDTIDIDVSGALTDMEVGLQNAQNALAFIKQAFAVKSWQIDTA